VLRNPAFAWSESEGRSTGGSYESGELVPEGGGAGLVHLAPRLTHTGAVWSGGWGSSTGSRGLDGDVAGGSSGGGGGGGDEDEDLTDHQ
jgi:hypothetical protein